MRHVLSAILLLFSCSVFGQVELHLPEPKAEKQGYRITKTKLIGWTVLGVAGFVDGAVEGYDFDDRVAFERLYGADPYGFWGSESWRKIYRNGRKADGCKTWLGCSLGAWDFYHVADDTRKLGYMAGGMTIGLGAKGQKFTHTLLDFAIGFGVGAVTKNLGMQYIRSWK